MNAPQPPAPNIVPTAALSHVAPYVDRLFASTKPAAVLMVSTLDGQSALTLLHMGGKTHFNLIAPWDAASGQEVAARHCFAGLQVTAQEKQGNDQRILSFVLAASPQSITNAAVAVMGQIYGVGIQDGLKFRFDEWSL